MDLKASTLLSGLVLLLAVTENLTLNSQPHHVDETKIVGGNQSSPNQFPYQVSLRGTYKRNHFCGGILVTARHVLTAAHCIKQSENVTLRAQDVLVYTGSIFLSRGGLYSPVLVIHVHKGYSTSSNLDDIAILKLFSSLRVFTSTNTVSLRAASIATNTNCTVSGWGATSFGGDVMDVLRYVIVPISDYAACKSVYSPLVTANMICAGFWDGGKDSCQGDSGGPLICDGSVTGIVSFGSGCALPGYPGVYTEVYKYNGWILDAINASLPTSTLSLCLLVIAQFAYFLRHYSS